MAAIGLSFAGHVLFALAFIGMIAWNGWQSSKVYVVNLVPMVAAVGSPTAPTQRVSLPAQPAPSLPSRAPTPTPTPEPRERPMREAPKLPEAALPTPSLPPRAAAPLRAGQKELPPLAHAASTSRVDKPERTERPVESRPASEAPRGLPTGSPTGVGARSLTASDFPYAWYLRQVTAKIEEAWQHQNQLNEPNQRPRVLFEIQRDGSIRPPRIGQSSGNTLYDQAALRAIVEASPFPPLPREWPKPSLTVEMTFQLEPARG
jgi:protein TonB